MNPLFKKGYFYNDIVAVSQDSSIPVIKYRCMHGDFVVSEVDNEEIGITISSCIEILFTHLFDMYGDNQISDDRKNKFVNDLISLIDRHQTVNNRLRRL